MHHRLTAMAPPCLDHVRFGRADLDPLLEAGVGWPVRWDVETWPLVIRQHTPVGRLLRVEAIRPGLVLIELGVDRTGQVAIEHHATALSDICPPELNRLSILAHAPSLSAAPSQVLSRRAHISGTTWGRNEPR